MQRVEGAGTAGAGSAMPAPGAGLGLLRTKLTHPRLPPGYVVRPNVDALLDAGTQATLTVVCAGAGWGKTLATAAWVARGPKVGPVAWVSLDATDNQPRAFWSYVVEALRSAMPMPPGSPLAGLEPGLGNDQERLRRVVAGLEQLPGPVVLVLDDFHLVDDATVLADIAMLLRAPAPQLRLVLLTRSDPVLPLHRLRVAGALTEVRSRDLALGRPEATRLLANDGVELRACDVEVLLERTEGWPAGLRLAALFLARDEPGHHVADFGGDDQAVVEYLAEEVLAAHPPEVRRFLLLTSVAERLCASLAEELTGQVGGQRVLESLAAENTFVVGLGPGRKWYRYHTLLRQTLRHRLAVEAPNEVAGLHVRAALWLAENGQPLAGLRHAAQAQDWQLMGRLLVTRALPLSLSAERSALALALSRIPPDQLATTPELAVAAATRTFLDNRLAEIEPHLALARELTPSTDPVVSAGSQVGQLLLATAVARTHGDSKQLVEVTTRALQVLEATGAALPAARAYRAIALSNLGTGQLWEGRLSGAEHTLRAGLAEAGPAAVDAGRVNLLSHLALSAAICGRLTTAHGLATNAIDIVEERGWAPLSQAATAHLALTLVHFQRDQVTSAREQLLLARETTALDALARCATAIAQIRLDAATGRVDEARRGLAGLHRDVSDWQPPALLARWVRITEAEVDLASGNAAAALRRVSLDHAAGRANALLPERLLRARALLAVGEPRAADEMLRPLRDADATHAPVVEAWVLTSLAADSLREDRRATDALRHAIEAAAQEGVRRPFRARDGDHLSRLIARVRLLHPHTVEFVDDLDRHLDASDPRTSDAPPLRTPLTDRELSVLQYLPTMLTYPEIALELFVSVNTVKSHLRHLFAKLDVANRRQAVSRARELGLLETRRVP